ncbi:hypothetical protein POVCU2_0019990 [Plasmodium ovale curtisi]|uniref:Uncharacterized protein n=1 Tax=Plasmodium ovale curtisi TaxID=864141 RepID=A0A1A8VWR8_PLAOA|nr:hypothetical protein POVCU2_0019990 [Plasmodium ovale curtisi]
MGKKQNSLGVKTGKRYPREIDLEEVIPGDDYGEGILTWRFWEIETTLRENAVVLDENTTELRENIVVLGEIADSMCEDATA